MGLIFLITGTPGVGKSATADTLMRRFPFGLHIPVDDLREWVVSGIAQPVPEFTAETGRQFRLARTAAAQTAALYADAGFAVALDDVIHEPDVEAMIAALAPRTVHKILLQPSLEAALARNASRTNKNFDTALLDEAVRGNHRSLAEQNRTDLGWTIIDNGALDVEQTVDAILESTLQAIINFRRLGPDADHRRPADRGAIGAGGRGRHGGCDQPGPAGPSLRAPRRARHGRGAGADLRAHPGRLGGTDHCRSRSFLRSDGSLRGTSAVRPLRGQLSRVGVQHAVSGAPARLAGRGRAARPGRHLGSGRIPAMAGVHRGQLAAGAAQMPGGADG